MQVGPASIATSILHRPGFNSFTHLSAGNRVGHYIVLGVPEYYRKLIGITGLIGQNVPRADPCLAIDIQRYIQVISATHIALSPQPLRAEQQGTCQQYNFEEMVMHTGTIRSLAMRSPGSNECLFQFLFLFCQPI
jgi:hypothetical protein